MFKLNEDFLEGMGVENESAEVKRAIACWRGKDDSRPSFTETDLNHGFPGGRLAGINESSAGAENWLAK